VPEVESTSQPDEPTQQRIWLLATGGTISTTVDPGSGRSAPTLSAGDLERLVDVAGVELRAESIDARPSWALSVDEMLAIAARARAAARDPATRGVVVTHGTTTLEYTAFLADLLLDTDTPVVFTGSMRKADHPDADGPRNLADAVAVAASEEARRRGALVVFAGRVIPARRAWKAQRLEADAFRSTGEEFGSVEDGLPRWSTAGSDSGPHRPRRIGPFRGDLERSVELLKVVPGMSDAALSRLDPGTKGLVIEALPGTGGIPPRLHEALRETARRIPVVIAPRSPFGEIPERPSGGTGEPLAEMPLLSAGPLTAEHAWLLLMLVLGEERNPDAARQRFTDELFGPAMRPDRSSEPTDRPKEDQRP
jgi:L-asparaginase